MALRTPFAFKDVPEHFIKIIQNLLLYMGFPYDGHEFAYYGVTRTSDERYLRDCVASGTLLHRRVYSIVNDRRIVVKEGQFGLDGSLMGPLSQFGSLFEMDEISWRRRTRIAPALKIIAKFKLNITVHGDDILINGTPVLVSGHILNALLHIAFIGTPATLAFDIRTFLDNYLENQLREVSSYEPTFNYFAWHSWLETFIALFALKDITDNSPIQLDPRAVRLSKATALRILVNIKSNQRTRVGVDRTKMFLLDTRYYTARPRFMFVAMPMGSGKTTLSKRYPDIFVDVDGLRDYPDFHKEEHVLRANKAVEDGNWDDYNKWYYPFVYRFISQNPYKVILLHHPDTARVMYSSGPCISVKISWNLTKEVLIARGNSDRLQLAKTNWESIKTSNIFNTHDALSMYIMDWYIHQLRPS